MKTFNSLKIILIVPFVVIGIIFNITNYAYADSEDHESHEDEHESRIHYIESEDKEYENHESKKYYFDFDDDNYFDDDEIIYSNEVNPIIIEDNLDEENISLDNNIVVKEIKPNETKIELLNNLYDNLSEIHKRIQEIELKFNLKNELDENREKQIGINSDNEILELINNIFLSLKNIMLN